MRGQATDCRQLQDAKAFNLKFWRGEQYQQRASCTSCNTRIDSYAGRWIIIQDKSVAVQYQGLIFESNTPHAMPFCLLSNVDSSCASRNNKNVDRISVQLMKKFLWNRNMFRADVSVRQSACIVVSSRTYSAKARH